jgi:ABC-2 type transport system permease protein
MGELIQAGIALAEAFSRWIPPLYLLGTAIQYRSITAFLQYILWMVLPLAIVFGVLSLFFRKLMTKKEATIRVAYKGKVEKRKPLYMALVEREVRRLMSLPMVVLNTCLGAIAAVFLAGVIIVRRDLFLTLLAEFGEIIDPTMMHAAASVMLMFLTMANSLSASSLSLEGQQLWNLKSLPIRSKDILLSKALYAFTLAYAPTLLVVAVYMVSFSVPLKMLPLFLLLPASAAVFSSLLGVWLNVAFPKLEWSNETVAVKQGMSVFLHMMVSLALMAGFVFIYLKYLMKNMSLVSYAYVLSAVFLSLGALLYALVVTKSVEMFHQMDA